MNAQLIKILSLLILTAVTAIVIKSYRPEFAYMFIVTAVTVIMIYTVKIIYPVLSDFKASLDKSTIPSSAFSVPIKALGIAYITGFVADTCRDFGQSALASKAELAGRCAIFVLTVPMLLNILETALKFAEK